MKKLLSLLLMSGVFLLLAFPAYAQGTEIASGKCGAEGDGSNLTWALDDTGTLTISGSGEMEDVFGYTHASWYSNRENITKVIIENGATSIGAWAFERCSNLTEVMIPESVTTIGYSAFIFCNSLTEIVIPEGVTKIESYVFNECSNLTKTTIPEGVISLGDYAFSGCASLTEIRIPKSVTSMGYSVFSSCTSLTDIYYGGTKEQWNEIAIDDYNEALNAVTIHYTDDVISVGDDSTSGSSGGCYVATAVYGSYDCPEVWTLRRYRDYELSQTAAGRAFIYTYYAVSPTIVEYFGDEEWFQDMWRGPLDKMVSSLQAKGYESTPYEDIAW